MKNNPTPSEVPGTRGLASGQNQGSGEGTLLSNATLDRLPKTVSIPGYDRGKISAGTCILVQATSIEPTKPFLSIAWCNT
jgi:hypothetical protein